MELCKAYKNKQSNIQCINKCKHGIFCGKHKNNSKPLSILPSSSMITGITIFKPITYNLYKVISQTAIYNNFLQQRAHYIHNTHNTHNTHTTNMLYVMLQRTSKTMTPYMRHVFMTPFCYMFLFY